MMALEGVKVHFVGRLSVPPGVLCARVEAAGGTCSMHIGTHLTHVVFGTLDAAKLQKCEMLDVKVVAESWIGAAIAAGDHNLVDPADHMPSRSGKRGLPHDSMSLGSSCKKRTPTPGISCYPQISSDLMPSQASAPLPPPAPVVSSVSDSASNGKANFVSPSAHPTGFSIIPPTDSHIAADLADGQSMEVAGSGSAKYIVKNVAGVFSCTCIAFKMQKVSWDLRTCKHISQIRGPEKEAKRIGVADGKENSSDKNKATAVVPSPLSTKDKSPPLLLAHNWKEDANYTGWWMSEKLDGVRALWNGQKFISRQGNEYMAPEWFTRSLPRDEHLDGELFVARGEFQKCVSIVRKQNAHLEWKSVVYCVFDLCTPERRGDPFETRWTHLQKLFHPALPYARLHSHNKVTGRADIEEQLEKVRASGGEGLMLRQPGSRYEAGRSNTLVKVKVFEDAEALVTGHEPGKGKHTGRMGALLCIDRGGACFKVGTGFSDAERETPPPVGSVITFKFQERTKAGVPRFLSYLRLRPDVPAKDFPSK